MDNPWTTSVKCQGPGCDKSARVNRPGEVRPGWLVLIKQGTVLTGQQPQMEQYPFCGMTCLFNWIKTRLPSKGAS